MNCRFFLLALAVLAATRPLHAQQPPAAAATQQDRQAAVERLLAERGDAKALQQAIEQASAAGVPRQTILEARFLYHVDMADDAAVAALRPEFEEQVKHFKLEDSAIFATQEDWHSVVEYVKAIHCLKRGDKEGFKRHITEAFWLGPRQAAAFAPQIERLRHEEAMQAIRFDFQLPMPLLTADGNAPLAPLIKDRKALLLHFWSPESTANAASISDFSKTAAVLAKHGIAVASVCAQKSPEALAVANAAAAGSGIWLVDHAERPLAKLLRVQLLPCMTLIDPQGKILYSGDPADEEFWRKLATIDKDITRPESDEELHR
ncbi:MAG TPA: hypothetical protein VFY13_03900 [Luteolibacter sp.]|nr:hypothetical protein [Luteolibacter sp.]